MTIEEKRMQVLSNASLILTQIGTYFINNGGIELLVIDDDHEMIRIPKEMSDEIIDAVSQATCEILAEKCANCVNSYEYGGELNCGLIEDMKCTKDTYCSHFKMPNKKETDNA